MLEGIKKNNQKTYVVRCLQGGKRDKTKKLKIILRLISRWYEQENWKNSNKKILKLLQVAEKDEKIKNCNIASHEKIKK